MDIELTKGERNAIATLERLANRWPKTLWIFCDGIGVRVMRCGPDGEHVARPGNGGTGGGMDPDYMVASVNIDNDGGDW